MSWATYTARILVVTYFTMSPFFYFFYFGILTKGKFTAMHFTQWPLVVSEGKVVNFLKAKRERES